MIPDWVTEADEYKAYLLRREAYYPEQTPLTREQFEAYQRRWHNEYDNAWDEEDFDTINELEESLCI